MNPQLIRYNEIFVATILTIFIVLGIFGNIMNILIIRRNKKLQSKSGYLLEILSYAHLFCVIQEPVSVYLAFAGQYITKKLCTQLILGFIFMAHFQAIMFFSITLDLFLAITFPLRHSAWPTSVYLLVLCAPAAIYGLIILLLHLLTYENTITLHCDPFFVLKEELTMIDVYILSIVCVLTVILFIITLITFHCQKSKSTIKKSVIIRIGVTAMAFVFTWFLLVFYHVVLFALFAPTDLNFIFLAGFIGIFAVLAFLQNYYIGIWRSKTFRQSSVEILKSGWKTVHDIYERRTTIM